MVALTLATFVQDSAAARLSALPKCVRNGKVTSGFGGILHLRSHLSAHLSILLQKWNSLMITGTYRASGGLQKQLADRAVNLHYCGSDRDWQAAATNIFSTALELLRE